MLQHLLIIHEPSIIDRIWTGSVSQADKSWKLWEHGDVTETNSVFRERYHLDMRKDAKEKKKNPSYWWFRHIDGPQRLLTEQKSKMTRCCHLFWERSPLQALLIRPHFCAAKWCLGSKRRGCNSISLKSNQNRIPILNTDWNFKL